MRLLKDDALNSAEVETGLRYATQQVACFLDNCSPTSNHWRLWHWKSFLSVLSKTLFTSQFVEHLAASLALKAKHSQKSASADKDHDDVFTKEQEHRRWHRCS